MCWTGARSRRIVPLRGWHSWSISDFVILHCNWSGEPLCNLLSCKITITKNQRLKIVIIYHNCELFTSRHSIVPDNYEKQINVEQNNRAMAWPTDGFGHCCVFYLSVRLRMRLVHLFTWLTQTLVRTAAVYMYRWYICLGIHTPDMYHSFYQ